MQQSNIIICILLTCSLFACKQKTIISEPAANENEQLIQISQKQFISDKMEIGSMSIHCFEDIICCNGYVSAPTNGIANMSTPISGIVKSIHFTPGDFVKKGQLMCQIVSNEFLALQQDYAETSAILIGTKADYERSKALYDEKIGAEKDFISAKSHYKATKAKYETLGLKLQLLHLSANRIKNGDFYSSLPLTAPINGYITNHKLVLGQYIEQQSPLLEIVDPSQLQIQISVFEKDIHQLKIGQKVHFKTLSNPKEFFTAYLSSIGKRIDSNTKTILCLAKIEEKAKTKLYNGSYIEAEITTNEKDADALPSQAIIKSGPDCYVFVVEKSDDQNYYLRKEKVKIGYESKGYSELLETSNINKVITEGVYNIPLE